jgi:hypothetical protein
MSDTDHKIHTEYQVPHSADGNYTIPNHVGDTVKITSKPSLGRIVLYNHPGSADGKYPPSQSPAIIQHVAPDGSCTLFVFGPKGQHMDSGLVQGDGPCQWNFPPRV